VKIALVAPFEGRMREVGYDAFPALRLALREQIAAGGIGDVEVTFVAYNDDADPRTAERVASNVTLDESVIAVIGHLRPDTTLAALEVYTRAGLPVLAPLVPADALPADPLLFRLGPASNTLAQALARCPTSNAPVQVFSGQPFKGALDANLWPLLPDLQSPAVSRLLGAQAAGLCFATSMPDPRDLPAAERALHGYSAVAGGPAPGARASAAYDTTRLLLQAMRADAAAHGTITRAGVAEALRHITYDGLLGRVSFDPQNTWPAAPVWAYVYDPSGAAQVLK
jgi:ABC-type branched-subunit amino acid transport system substrate-binding protein